MATTAMTTRWWMTAAALVLVPLAASVLVGACALPEATKVDGSGGGGGSVDGGAGGIGGAGGMGGMGGDPGPCYSERGPTMVEAPQVIGSACIDSTEVTRGQYNAFFLAMQNGEQVQQHPSCSGNTDFIPGAPQLPGYVPTDAHPITNIDWCDAYAFCEWAGKRLCGAVGGGPAPYSVGGPAPEEDEHYFVCSKGYTQVFPYGNTYDPDACHGQESGMYYPVEAGSHPGCEGGFPGVFDLYGNVVEWINGCESDAPNALCIARGGSFVDSAVYCDGQFGRARNESGSNIGFRCCRNL